MNFTADWPLLRRRPQALKWWNSLCFYGLIVPGAMEAAVDLYAALADRKGS